MVSNIFPYDGSYASFVLDGQRGQISLRSIRRGTTPLATFQDDCGMYLQPLTMSDAANIEAAIINSIGA